jgi:D-galactarolactone cycloisomerase
LRSWARDQADSGGHYSGPLSIDLTIEAIETIGVRVPLARRYSGSSYHMDNRCTIVTRLFTRGGLVGEVYNGDSDSEQERIIRIMHEELLPRLRGHSAADPEGCWLAMEPVTRNILRDRGLALQAIGCVDSSIWDVFGKAIGLPLYRLWGGCTDRLPLSVIGGYYDLDGTVGDLIGRYRDFGFRGCKFKVGGRSPSVDADRVQAARKEAGDEFVLMADANQAYTRDEAVEFGRRVIELNLRWFEEPCRWTNDRRWMRDVRLQTGIPIAAGQSESTLAGLRDLMIEGAIDVSNFDASWSGGPTVWRKAAGLAAAFEVQLGHHEEPQIAAHLLASVPSATFVECFDQDRDPLFWSIQASPPQIREGMFVLPKGNGFGLELDWDYVAQHEVSRRTSKADSRS